MNPPVIKLNTPVACDGVTYSKVLPHREMVQCEGLSGMTFTDAVRMIVANTGLSLEAVYEMAADDFFDVLDALATYWDQKALHDMPAAGAC